MFALFNTEQAFQMPTSSFCFTRQLNPGVVYLRKYAADVEQVLVPLKLKMTFFQLCVYVQRVIRNHFQGLDAQRQWYIYEEAASYCSDAEVCLRPAAQNKYEGGT